MEIKITDEKKNRIVFELIGVSHGFCNVLKRELLNDEHVKVASYKVEHPLVGVPTMILETDGKEAPKSVLTKAADRLSKKSSEVKKKIEKELK